MTLKSFSFVALLISGFGISSQPVSAQSDIREVPVNFPPDSYEERQFVDNRGCVYVRAGFDGAVTWVPRVSRQREPICGQTPTFGTEAALEPAAPAPAAAEPVQVTATSPDEAPPQTAAPTPVAAAAEAPVRTAPTSAASARSVARAPASKPAAALPPRVLRRVPAQTLMSRKGSDRNVSLKTMMGVAQSTCPPGQPYRIINGEQLRVECGVEIGANVTTVRNGERPGTVRKIVHAKGDRSGIKSNLPPQTRIVPDHVYKERDTQVAHVPLGYRPAWSDGRLNPYRAYQTVEGYRASQKVWTNKVPRRLVVQAKRHEIKDPVIVGHASAPLPVTRHVARTPHVTSKGEPRDAAPGTSANDARWIEIGAFTTEEKARTAASRLQAAGLTVRMAQHQQNGQTMSRLRVGPYASQGALQTGLSRVHGSGYTQAYIR